VWLLCKICQVLKFILNFNNTFTVYTRTQLLSVNKCNLGFKNEFAIHVIKSKLLSSLKNSIWRSIHSKPFDGIYNLPPGFDGHHVTQCGYQWVLCQHLQSFTNIAPHSSKTATVILSPTENIVIWVSLFIIHYYSFIRHGMSERRPHTA